MTNWASQAARDAHADNAQNFKRCTLCGSRFAVFRSPLAEPCCIACFNLWHEPRKP